MCLFGAHPRRNETEALSNPEDMRVDREGVSPEAEKKETVNGLRTDAVEAPEGLFDRLGIGRAQRGQAEPSEMHLDPSEDLFDATGFLLGQPARTDRADKAPSACTEDILPFRESRFQGLISPIPISVVGIL